MVKRVLKQLAVWFFRKTYNLKKANKEKQTNSKNLGGKENGTV